MNFSGSELVKVGGHGTAISCLSRPKLAILVINIHISTDTYPYLVVPVLAYDVSCSSEVEVAVRSCLMHSPQTGPKAVPCIMLCFGP